MFWCKEVVVVVVVVMVVEREGATKQLSNQLLKESFTQLLLPESRLSAI